MKIELNRVYTLKLTNADEVVAKIIEDNADQYVLHLSQFKPEPNKPVHAMLIRT